MGKKNRKILDVGAKKDSGGKWNSRQTVVRRKELPTEPLRHFFSSSSVVLQSNTEELLKNY